MLNKNIIKSIQALALKIVAGLLSYLVFIVLARILSADNYGQFAVYFSVLMLVALFGSLGQSNFFLKQVEITRLNGFSDKIVSSFSLYTNIIGILIGGIIWAFFLIYQSSNSIIVFLVGLLFIFLFSISQTFMGMLRSYGLVNYFVFVRDVLWRLLTLCMVYFLYVFSAELGYESALVVFSIALIIPVTFCLSRLYYLGVLSFNFNDFSYGCKRGWLKVSFSLAIISIVSSSDGYLFNILTGYLFTVKEAGGFFASLKTIELVSVFLMAVSLVFSKDYAYLLARRNVVALQRKCNIAIVTQTVPVLFCFSIIVFFGDIVLKLFNESFVEYLTLLKIMAVAMLINTLTGSTGSLMQLGGLHWTHVKLQTLSILIGILSAFPLSILYGVEGIGWAYLVSKIIWNFLAVYWIRNKIGIDPSIFAFFGNYNGCNKFLQSDIKHMSPI